MPRCPGQIDWRCLSSPQRMRALAHVTFRVSGSIAGRALLCGRPLQSLHQLMGEKPRGCSSVGRLLPAFPTRLQSPSIDHATHRMCRGSHSALFASGCRLTYCHFSLRDLPLQRPRGGAVASQLCVRFQRWSLHHMTVLLSLIAL